MALEACQLLATTDHMRHDLAYLQRQVNVDHFPHTIVINSNYRFDWTDFLDLGFVNKCRFHTDGSAPLFLRVFRLNPVFDGTQWLERDRLGA